MKILHVVPGLGNTFNGIAVAAKLLSARQTESGAQVTLVDSCDFLSSCCADALRACSEVWVHSMWTPKTMKACRAVLAAGVPLVRMTHANLDPLRLRSKGWKKLPVWRLLERRLINRSSRVVTTCVAESDWNRRAGVTAPIEVVDLKRCFELDGTVCRRRKAEDGLHILFLGRAADPLKGVRFLERAVDEMRVVGETGGPTEVELRLVSDHFGEELERDWTWCDVLCLPTLSENFGLVVAEAIERGKFVVTTDGAPAWADYFAAHPEKGVYIKGFRDGSDDYRVSSLATALASTLARGA